MTDVLPDAAPDNWVDRFAPERLRPWLKLARLDRPAGIWLLLLPGWWGIALAGGQAGRLPDVTLLMLFAVGAVLMRSAGCAFNDVVDRDIDRQVTRTAGRPVASGAISVKGALGFVVGCCLISFGILLTLGETAIALGVASLVLVSAYPFMKRITWWPQAWLGLTFNWGALMGFAAVVSGNNVLEDQASWGTWVIYAPGVLLYLAGVFWTLGYDTIYAVQDVEDDALAGVKSSARRLGRGLRTGVGVFYGLAMTLALVAGWAAGLGPGFLAGWVLFCGHLAWQASRVRVDDPALCLKLFRSNRDAGLILFAAIVAGGLWR
jgi:4-hydroxybenzoate polyprenyltransferase